MRFGKQRCHDIEAPLQLGSRQGLADGKAHMARGAVHATDAITETLGGKPIVWLKTNNLMAVFGDEADVATLMPDFRSLGRLLAPMNAGLIATAPGSGGIDFVSRFFAPVHGIDEDPVTGSAHCTSVPYWAKKLGKCDFVARQISKRGGALWCSDAGERVVMRGRCADYMKAEISF